MRHILTCGLPGSRIFFLINDGWGMWHVWRGRCAQGFFVGKPEGKRPLGRPRRRWGIILRWIFRKWEGVVGTGWSWLRIGTGGGYLCVW